MVVGLVAITPAAGLVGPMAALALGGIAAVSYYALLWRARTRAGTRWTWWPPTASGGRGRAAHRRFRGARPGTGTVDGLLYGDSRPARDPGGGRPRRHRLQRRGLPGPAEAHRPGDPARRQRRGRRSRSRHQPHGEEAYGGRGRCDPDPCQDRSRGFPCRSCSPRPLEVAGGSPWWRSFGRKSWRTSWRPCSMPRCWASPSTGGRGGEKTEGRRTTAGTAGEDGAVREGAAGDRGLGSLRRAHGERDRRGRAHGRGGGTARVT